VHDSSKPEPEAPQGSATAIERSQDSSEDVGEDIRPWWRRSPALAAGAALAIGLATLWFANMIGRVPLDAHSTLGYLLMLPLLLIVPAFSAAGLRLSWLAQGNATRGWIIGTTAWAAMAMNAVAIARFGTALWRIFSY
jgi:hypothetical protein